LSSAVSPALREVPKAERPEGEESPRFVRGSSLLLGARILAQGAEFGLQLFFVHFLAKSDYGALAYAFSILFLLRAVAVFEQPVTLARFLPLYREQRRFARLLGSVILGVALVAALGVLIALALDASLIFLQFKPTDDRQALIVLAILVLAVPIEALDILLTSLFATFATPRAIFIRQGVVGPGLKLALVAGIVATQADLVHIALGYVGTDALLLAIYSSMFVRMLKRQSELADVRRRKLSYPVRETMAFATPLLAGTLVWILMDASDAVLLGYFHSTQEVAAFRAVLVVALLNQGVTFTFALLYTPMLARLYARGDLARMKDFYWRSTLWVTVLSFPVFVLTFSFASTTTVGIVGDRYADSAGIMALLAFGYFFHSSLGFNGLTLRVFGKLRYSVAIDIAAAAMNVLVNLLLIPPWGAVGAAVGTASTLVLHNVFKQYGLWKYTGISWFPRGYVPIYLALFGAAATLAVLQTALPANLLLAIALTLMVTVAVAWTSRGALQLRQVFPELARWPLIRALAEPSRLR
jgi:O-antigen/teichoic acid export membrane protein